MTFLKKLLAGGIPAAGIVAVSTVVGLNVNKKEEDDVVEEEKKEGEKDEIAEIDIKTQNPEDQKKVLKRAGLDCGDLKDGSTCKAIAKKGASINNGTKEEELIFSSSNSSSLVLGKNKSSPYGLSFTVKKGDIQLTKKDGGGSPAIQKLERYERYEMKVEGDEKNKKVYLTRSRTSDEGKMEALGLPTNCTLPKGDGTSTNCQINYNQIKSVHFDGRKAGGASATVVNTLDTKKVALTITKSSVSNQFKDGYKFSFTPDVDLKISDSLTIRGGTRTDFSIKDWNDENMVLFGAWSNINELIKKVGLSCNSSTGVCTITPSSLKVKQGNNKLTGGSKTGTNGGSIKLLKNQGNFANGLKFEIIGGDISLSGNTSGSPTINKLSRYEDYEIVESEREFYLSRRYEPIYEIAKLLGISVTINGTGAADNSGLIVKSSNPYTYFKTIKFYDNNREATSSGSATVDVGIYKSEDTNTFKYGYKFTLISNGEMKIGERIKLKTNVPMDFKIKEVGEKMYLERVSNPEDLIEKVGLTCTKGGENEFCTFKEGNVVNIKHWDRSLKGAEAVTGEHVGKLKLTRDVPKDYYEGFMFEVINGDITFRGGTDVGDGIRMGEFEKYEIKLDGGIWYLYQKRNFMQEKHGALGIKGNCENSFQKPCEMGGMYVSNNVKFKAKKGKDAKGQFLRDDPKVQLKLHKESLYPFGLRVSMKVEGGDDKNVSVVCKENENITLIKLTNNEMNFQIEKIDGSFYLSRTGGAEVDTECIPFSSQVDN